MLMQISAFGSQNLNYGPKVNQISSKMPRQEWELFTSELIKTQYKLSLGELSQLLEQFTNQALTK